MERIIIISPIASDHKYYFSYLGGNQQLFVQFKLKFKPENDLILSVENGCFSMLLFVVRVTI